MKFSVKYLLALTLLAALAINGCVTFTRYNALTGQRQFLLTENRSLAGQTAYFAEKKQIFTEAFDAVQQRRKYFDDACRQFEKLANEQSQFDLTDPSKLQLEEIATLEPKNGFHNRTRVWLPASQQFRLSIGFSDRDAVLTGTALKESNWFTPRTTFTVPLDSGESEIGIRWIDGHARKVVRFFVNGEAVHEIFAEHDLYCGARSNSFTAPQPNSIPFHTDLFVANYDLKKATPETLLVQLELSDREEPANE